MPKASALRISGSSRPAQGKRRRRSKPLSGGGGDKENAGSVSPEQRWRAIIAARNETYNQDLENYL